MHPGMQLSEPSERGAISRLFCAISAENVEADRLPGPDAASYALRWCAIILGELLPERWQHRIAEQSGYGQLGSGPPRANRQGAKL